MLTDQRAKFESAIVQNLCTIWRIDKVCTTAYQPAGNGACEPLKETIKRGLQKTLNEKRMEDWDVVLSEVMFAYNTSVHTTTGFTPYFLTVGVEARVPSDILVGLPEMERTPAVYAFQRYQKLGVAYEASREATYTATKRAKDYYDMGAIQKEFKVVGQRSHTDGAVESAPDETALQVVQVVPHRGCERSDCHGGGSGHEGICYGARR